MNEPDNCCPPLSDQELRDKIKDEVAPVSWLDLQIAYARGIVLQVSNQLEMAEVAFEISKNNTVLVSQWVEEKKLSHIRDDQALEWFNKQAELLTTIVKPWVLIQELS